MLFETAIICTTVGLMCPAMSFVAAWLYYPYYTGFQVTTLLANWGKLVCFNLPFAYFSQLFLSNPWCAQCSKGSFRGILPPENSGLKKPGRGERNFAREMRRRPLQTRPSAWMRLKRITYKAQLYSPVP